MLAGGGGLRPALQAPGEGAGGGRRPPQVVAAHPAAEGSRAAPPALGAGVGGLGRDLRGAGGGGGGGVGSVGGVGRGGDLRGVGAVEGMAGVRVAGGDGGIGIEVGVDLLLRRRAAGRFTQTLAHRQVVVTVAQVAFDLQAGDVPQPGGAEGREGEAEVHGQRAGVAALSDPRPGPGALTALAAAIEGGGGVEPAVGGQLAAPAQEVAQGGGPPALGGERAPPADRRERNPEHSEVAAERQPVAIEVAHYDADALRPGAAVEQRPHPHRQLADLGVGAGGLERRQPAWRGRGGRRRRRRGPAAAAGGTESGLREPLHRARCRQPLLEAGGERMTGRRVAAAVRRRIRREVEHHLGRAVAEKRLEEIDGDPGRVGEAVHQDGARRQRPLRGRHQERRGPTKEGRGPSHSGRLDRLGEVGRHPHQRPGPRHFGGRRDGRAVRGQRLVRRLGVLRLEAGVEQVAGGGRHRRVAVDQAVEGTGQLRLRPRPPPHQHVGEVPAPGEAIVLGVPVPENLRAPFQDLERDTVERLHRDPDRRPPPTAHQCRREMEPQALRGDDYPHRPGEERRVARRGGEQRLQAIEQCRLAGHGPAGDEDPRPAGTR